MPPEKLRKLYGKKFYGVTSGEERSCILVYTTLDAAKKNLREDESILVEVEITRVSTVNPFLTEIERDVAVQVNSAELDTADRTGRKPRP